MSGMLCIRCGSKDHSTRDHDEGKTGDAPIKSATGETYGNGSPKKAAPKRSMSASPSSPASKARNAALYKDAKIQPTNCWKTVGRHPGIPDIIAPKIIERHADGQCINFLGDLLGDLKAKCPCKACQRKAEKATLDALRRRGKID